MTVWQPRLDAHAHNRYSDNAGTDLPARAAGSRGTTTQSLGSNASPSEGMVSDWSSWPLWRATTVTRVSYADRRSHTAINDRYRRPIWRRSGLIGGASLQALVYAVEGFCGVDQLSGLWPWHLGMPGKPMIHLPLWGWAVTASISLGLSRAATWLANQAGDRRRGFRAVIWPLWGAALFGGMLLRWCF